MKKSMINLIKTIKIISIIFIFTFVIGCVSKKPIFKPVNVVFENSLSTDFANVINVIHTINTTYTNEGKKEKLSGTSFHIGNGYILACTHEVEETGRVARTPFGIVYVPIDGTDYKYFIGKDEIELIGSIADVSLFYSPKLIDSLSVTMVDSDLLKVGDQLMLIGNTSMNGINIKLGIVSILSLNKPVLDNPIKTAKETFVMALPTNKGDSGGPVFVIDKNTKKYYLIGMAFAILMKADGYGFAIKSNYLSGVINKLKDQEFNQY